MVRGLFSALAFVVCLSTVTPLGAAATVAAESAIFRLDSQATFQDNCGPPFSVRGVFVLGPAIIGNAVDFHEISDIYWRVCNGDGTVLHTITGSGLYRITNFGPPQVHAIDFDLSIDGAAPQHFFSDFVDVPADDSFDFVVTGSGGPCEGIALRVDASVVPQQEIMQYGLTSGSTIQQGCFGSAGCQPKDPRAIRGSFRRVTLFANGTFAEYAIVQVRFHVLANDPDPSLTIDGNGVYTLIQGFAGPIQGIDLQLSLAGGALADFDQELENIGHIFPRINIVADMNDQDGRDTVLTIMARPMRTFSWRN